jgi:hypothetical protein
LLFGNFGVGGNNGGFLVDSLDGGPPSVDFPGAPDNDVFIGNVPVQSNSVTFSPPSSGAAVGRPDLLFGNFGFSGNNGGFLVDSLDGGPPSVDFPGAPDNDVLNPVSFSNAGGALRGFPFSSGDF